MGKSDVENIVLNRQGETLDLFGATTISLKGSRQLRFQDELQVRLK